MSWGYFIDLRLTLPATGWTSLARRAASEVVLPAGWSGLEDQSLEASFAGWDGDGMTFSELLAQPVYTTTDAIGEIDDAGETATLRVARMLDKSQLELAGPLARLFQAARDISGAAGTLVLVNDGTFSGEDGVELSLAKGKLATRRLADSFSLAVQIGTEIFGGMMGAEGAPTTYLDPFTGEPLNVKAKSSKAKASKRTSPKAKSSKAKASTAKAKPKASKRTSPKAKASKAKASKAKATKAKASKTKAKPASPKATGKRR